MRPIGLVALMAALAGGGAPAAGPRQTNADAAVEHVLGGYVAAWDRADPRAIAGAFAPDGDFINPDGIYARGRPAVETFYRAAFARGYAGSRGGFTPKVVRRLSRDFIVVDGEWSIEGARTEQGAARPNESGIATALLVRRGGRWQVAVLREQDSAKRIER